MNLNKVEDDLEFKKVKSMAAEYCHTESGMQYCMQLSPSTNEEVLLFDLHCVKEYTESFKNLSIPGFQAEEIQLEIARLKIPGSVLEAEGILNILSLNKGINYLIQFLVKQEEIYPHLLKRLNHIEPTKTVIDLIEGIFDSHGEVKSSASPTLSSIRRKMGGLRKEIERNFLAELAKYRNAGMLDDTKESYINGRRVLTVPSEFKRRVKGTLFGTSNSGKLSYIEPASNVALNNELAYLQQEERDEIYRILKALCDDLREHVEQLELWQVALVDWDTIQARAKLANQMNATFPTYHKEPTVELIDAYHPLLMLENKASYTPTLPQSIHLDGDKRILVISGPNAGGKSITLKTIGLLQIMFQSGMLIPAQPHSKVSLFNHILTDIGDNQSIENKLSTYSYRLQNMKHFLDVADYRTLFLIDEFGTGSDPELGGALAEVFFEELYHRDSIGVITTHYANIKILADRLPHAINASMLFNKETLEPLFKLSIGQPGSSFTFEVAEKNNIPKHLIEDAKQRVESGKLKLDESIASLHEEKNKLSAQIHDLAGQQRKIAEQGSDFDFRREEYEFKLLRLQQTQQEHNDYINYGKRLKELLDSYNGKNIKKVIAEFVKQLKIEFTKRQTAPKPQKPKLAPIEKQKSKLDLLVNQPVKPTKPLEKGDKVVIDQGEEVGIVDEIKGKKAFVIFGSLRTQVDVKRLNLPQKKKKR